MYGLPDGKGGDLPVPLVLIRLAEKAELDYDPHCPDLQVLESFTANGIDYLDAVKVASHTAKCDSCFSVYTKVLHPQFVKMADEVKEGNLENFLKLLFEGSFPYSEDPAN